MNDKLNNQADFLFEYENDNMESFDIDNPVGLSLLKLQDKFDSKKIPFDKLSELNEYAINIQKDPSKNDEKYISNKILVLQQDKYYKDLPFKYAYTRLAQNLIDRGDVDEAITLYNILKKMPNQPELNKMAQNALNKTNGAVNEHDILKCIKNFDDAITTAISFRKTRKMRYEFVVNIVDLACQYALTTQDKLRVAVEYKKLKQVDKAKVLLDEINQKGLIKGKINDVVYAAALRKEKAYEEAKSLYELVLDDEPNNTYAIVGYAAVLKDVGNYQEAYDLCMDLLKLKNSIPAINVLVSILKKTNNTDLARNIIYELEKIYANFDPFKYLNELIERYKNRGNIDGVNRITKIKRALENKYT